MVGTMVGSIDLDRILRLLILLPSRQKNIDNISTLLLTRSIFLNRRGAESTEGIKKKLIYSL
jgi:HD superfamily phosphohydrolase